VKKLEKEGSGSEGRFWRVQGLLLRHVFESFRWWFSCRLRRSSKL
jgi:hypothetical protein